ncbi:MAG: hypothetical protein Terrestrivirus1_245 [Terrestrivirus sp.]|uniref:Uncharacterized protein n=1 Tax=Terrestrivirus sp. TaxID=2487775 RepID=A0A3G4ZMU7_9VIRU|nr:MAG: hypothetical protein Terrestrivirus1_245 [Terrestrivirus sp.]
MEENWYSSIQSQLVCRDNNMKSYEAMIYEINRYKERCNDALKENRILKTKQNDVTTSKIYDEQFSSTMKNIISDKNVNDRERNKIFEKLMDHNILQQKLLSTKEVIIANNNKIKILEQELSISQKKIVELEKLKNESSDALATTKLELIMLQKENVMFLNSLIKEKDEKNKITSELLNCESQIKMLRANEKKLKDEVFILEIEFNAMKGKLSSIIIDDNNDNNDNNDSDKNVFNSRDTTLSRENTSKFELDKFDKFDKFDKSDKLDKLDELDELDEFDEFDETGDYEII